MINFADDRTHNLQHAKRTLFLMDLKAGLYGDVLECSLCMLYFFIFLSNFQTLIFFVTLFSRTVRPRRLKLGTHVDSGQMYRVYRNQAAAAYLSLYFFIFFLSSFQILKFFVTPLSGTVRPRRLKLGTHVDSGWMYHVYQNQAAAAYSSLYFFFLQYSNIKNFRHTFLSCGP